MVLGKRRSLFSALNLLPRYFIWDTYTFSRHTREKSLLSTFSLPLRNGIPERHSSSPYNLLSHKSHLTNMSVTIASLQLPRGTSFWSSNGCIFTCISHFFQTPCLGKGWYWWLSLARCTHRRMHLLTCYRRGMCTSSPFTSNVEAFGYGILLLHTWPNLKDSVFKLSHWRSVSSNKLTSLFIAGQSKTSYQFSDWNTSLCRCGEVRLCLGS